MKIESLKLGRYFIYRIFFCIFVAAMTIYFYIDKQNDLTELRRRLPELSKEVQKIQEDNARFQYEIDQFESPLHLMELARKPEFSHLKFPYLDKIVVLPEGKPPETRSLQEMHDSWNK